VAQAPWHEHGGTGTIGIDTPGIMGTWLCVQLSPT
jgi:hypothetical protein